MLIVLFIAGLMLLIAGAEALVRGASRLAAMLGISPLVIGLTVVAFGTSSPELAVSIKAASSDQSSIAVGNVVGSNIFNVLFILGLSALIRPLAVSQKLVRLDVPLMIGLSGLVLLLGLDGAFGHFDGIFLFTGLIMYLGFLVYKTREEKGEEYTRAFSRSESTRGGWPIHLGFVLGGLTLLAVGSRLLVSGAVSIAEYMGVSELVIGLTIVAVGTSLPEVVTSLVAGIRDEPDICVGNVVGSNIFNIMGVLGLSSIISPSGLEVSPALLAFDLPVMIVVAFACFPIFFTGARISRWEGVLLLGYFLAYTLYLIMAAGHHEALRGFRTAILYFVIPLTLATLIVLAGRDVRRKIRN
jgi:cation:H+ antiporter